MAPFSGTAEGLIGGTTTFDDQSALGGEGGLLTIGYAGTGKTFLTAKIVKHFTKSDAQALFALAFFLFNPWSIFISLSGVEAPLMVFFIFIAIFYLLRWFEEKRMLRIFLCGMFGGFAFIR